ncbi:hypothetical protein EAF00_008463 [Botryotinia globosa]|nr:hypothetical protein EAF00_008463 [Botryotinia globosa]
MSARTGWRSAGDHLLRRHLAHPIGGRTWFIVERSRLLTILWQHFDSSRKLVIRLSCGLRMSMALSKSSKEMGAIYIIQHGESIRQLQKSSQDYTASPRKVRHNVVQAVQQASFELVK